MHGNGKAPVHRGNLGHVSDRMTNLGKGFGIDFNLAGEGLDEAEYALQ